MKRLATVSSKGQITIPKELRDCLGISPGDRVELEVEVDDERILLKKKLLLPLKELKGILPPLGMDPDEAIRLARDEYIARKYGSRQ